MTLSRYRPVRHNRNSKCVVATQLSCYVCRSGYSCYGDHFSESQLATGAEAIEAVTDATGLVSWTVNGAARALREASPNLWPQGAKGGGRRAAHVEPAHLINLALALNIANPITQAPELVPIWGDLAVQDHPWAKPPPPQRLPANFNELLNTVDKRYPYSPPLPSITSWKRQIGVSFPSSRAPLSAYRVLPGVTLREALTNLIDWISRPEGAEVRSDLYDKEMTILLSWRPIPGPLFEPKARISYKSGPVYETCNVYTQRQLPLTHERESALRRHPAAPMRSATITFSLFEVLADLWSDTLVRRSIYSTLSSPAVAPASATPGTESAGSPAREPAPTRDQDRVADLVTPQPEYGRGKKFSQALSERGPGPSPIEGVRHHGPPESYSPTAASAGSG